MKRIYLDCSKACPSNVHPKKQIIPSLLKKRRNFIFWRQFFSSSLGCLCLTSRSHFSSPSWNIVVAVEKIRFFSSHSFLLSFYPQPLLFPFLKRDHQRPILPAGQITTLPELINLFLPQICPFPGGKRAPIISLRWKEQIRRDKEPFPTTINSNSNQTFFSTVGKHLYQLVSRNVDFWQRLKSNSRNFTSVVLWQADTWEDCSKPGAISRAGARYSPSQLKLFTWRYSELMRT